MRELTARKTGFVSKIIAKYENWETGKGASECF